MTQPLHFSIPRSRLALLSASLVVSFLLLYSAGIITGMMLNPGWLNNSRRELPGNPLRANNRPSTSVLPVLHEPKTRTNLSAPKLNPNQDFGPTHTRLAVQVAIFNDRIRAQSFADSLKRQGFPSLPVEAITTGEQTWYSVRLGPYADWDAASRAAAGVQRSYDVHTSVRPL